MMVGLDKNDDISRTEMDILLNAMEAKAEERFTQADLNSTRFISPEAHKRIAFEMHDTNGVDHLSPENLATANTAIEVRGINMSTKSIISRALMKRRPESYDALQYHHLGTSDADSLNCICAVEERTGCYNNKQRKKNKRHAKIKNRRDVKPTLSWSAVPPQLHKPLGYHPYVCRKIWRSL